MHFSRVVLTSAAASIAAAAPFSFPLANGFPNLNATALQQVFKVAGGTLPNGPAPSSLKAGGVQALQLVAANELFEVAYFTELVHNITTGVSGYKCGRNALENLKAVVAQEQIHALSANSVLANAKAETIQPCKYSFPVDNFDDAISLAQTFTEVVLGVLPAAQALFACDGGEEAGLVPVVSSIIGQEGEQVGYYRSIQNKVASSSPLLTGGAPQFAYTAISQFIVPGSCPNIEAIGLTAFPALTITSTPEARNSTQKFAIEGGNITASSASIAYISGQNLPVVVPISNVETKGNMTTFSAAFPYEAGFARGLTIGALVKGCGPFNSSSDVAAATLNGPALIKVD
ncbi:late sexual development protein [Cadophora sp. MPI-SDFR-AT-0126]|nr:late sexual development protein [Leotiomycetes sp. MPI-SDFR-AT-0126]